MTRLTEKVLTERVVNDTSVFAERLTEGDKTSIQNEAFDIAESMIRPSTSVFGGDLHYIQLAMSILSGVECRDGDKYPSLPVEQAKDVCAWRDPIV